MSENTSMVDALKQRYNFSSWAGQERLDEHLFVRNYFLSDRAVNDWQLVKVEEIKIPNVPKCNRSFWMKPGMGPEASISCDTYECDSREAAHEFLINILGTFHSPLVERREDLPIGDVAFAPPGEASITFARANIVFVVSRAGRGDFSVTDFAAQLDAELAGKPEETRRAAEDTDLNSMLREARRISESTIERTGEEEQVQLRFFSRSADFAVSGDELVYSSTDESAPEVTMFTVSSHGTAVRQDLGSTAATSEEETT